MHAKITRLIFKLISVFLIQSFFMLDIAGADLGKNFCVQGGFDKHSHFWHKTPELEPAFLVIQKILFEGKFDEKKFNI